MTADNLLRLYPRAWRDRYGDEFLEMTGRDALHLQQVIDIVGGAIDAWLSSDVRRSAKQKSGTGRTVSGGTIVTHVMTGGCTSARFRYTKRDALIGAGVMLLGTLLSTVLGVVARRNGMPMVAEMLLSNSFLGSMMLSMPFWLLKGQPWRAQVVLIGGMIAMMVAITYIAALL
jgi:hypothetical protein